MNNNKITLIVKKAQTGGQKAMSQLITTYNDQIFRLVFYRVNSWTDAQDLTQEAFLKAFKNINRLKDAEKFKPWLYSIALNLVNDFHRKRKFLSFFGQANDLENINGKNQDPNFDNKSSLIKAKEFEEKIKKKYLKFLSKNEKLVFLLKYIDDLTIHEIAQTTDKSESTVKTHLYRSIKKIKEHGGKLNEK
jgi:RNA polymerase sigma-70 factor (ECF subfamily)